MPLVLGKQQWFSFDLHGASVYKSAISKFLYLHQILHKYIVNESMFKGYKLCFTQLKLNNNWLGFNLAPTGLVFFATADEAVIFKLR